MNEKMKNLAKSMGGGGVANGGSKKADSLCLAIEAGNIKKVKDTIKKLTVEINHISSINDKTALQTACYLANSEIVDLLLAHRNINVNEVDKNNWSALHFAINSRDLKVVAKLLTRADIDTSILTRDSTSALHYLCRIPYPPELENLLKAVFCNLMEKNINLGVNALDKNKETPLHNATQRANKLAVELLLSYKADVNLQNSLGETPLFYAVKNDDTEIIELLLSKGADLNITPSSSITSLLSIASPSTNMCIQEYINTRGGGQMQPIMIMGESKKVQLSTSQPHTPSRRLSVELNTPPISAFPNLGAGGMMMMMMGGLPPPPNIPLPLPPSSPSSLLSSSSSPSSSESPRRAALRNSTPPTHSPPILIDDDHNINYDDRTSSYYYTNPPHTNPHPLHSNNHISPLSGGMGGGYSPSPPSYSSPPSTTTQPSPLSSPILQPMMMIGGGIPTPVSNIGGGGLGGGGQQQQQQVLTYELVSRYKSYLEFQKLEILKIMQTIESFHKPFNSQLPIHAILYYFHAAASSSSPSSQSPPLPSSSSLPSA